MKNIINFEIAKRKFVSDTIYVGDVVEWHDEHEITHEGQVISIHLGETSADSFSIWEKAEYSVSFKEGVSIWGGCIVRKIVGGVNRPLLTIGQALKKQYSSGYFN